MNRTALEQEIRRRATAFANQTFLDVDYYRIRRKLAYPLPLRSLSIPSVPVPTIPDYPWSIWMLWALEERVHSLGWAAAWFGDEAYARAASRDVAGLAEFATFHQLDRPDLAAGHSGRLLWAAATKWRWVDKTLREKILAACNRHVEEIKPFSEKYYGQIRSKADILALSSPYPKLHNIPLIGTIGASLAGSAAGHPAAKLLNGFVQAVVGAILDLLGKGYTEAVAYDGYILDFVGDWLETLPAAERKPVLDHPKLGQLLDESCRLSAPGAMEQLAELGDVEPREMPFHYSAQAKLAKFRSDPTRAWYLRRWRPDWMRADAIGALHPIVDRLQGKAPDASAQTAGYAVVLRTGWEPDDLAVAVSCSNSAAGHLQLDNGTVVIGTKGRWIVSDPGYQQYMADVEREFTIGPAAHNCPVIDGHPQDKKEPRLITLESVAPGLLRASLDLTACYPAKAKLKSVTRTVWLSGRDGIVVADEVRGNGIENLKYHWHGHAQAAWWARDGWILLHLPDAALWLTSPQASLSGQNIQRLAGSRGQLTLVTEADRSAPVIWWVFALADTPPKVRLLPGGRGMEFLGRRFQT